MLCVCKTETTHAGVEEGLIIIIEYNYYPSWLFYKCFALYKDNGHKTGLMNHKYNIVSSTDWMYFLRYFSKIIIFFINYLEESILLPDS